MVYGPNRAGSTERTVFGVARPAAVDSGRYTDPMKKVLLGVLALFVLVVGGVVVAAMFQPDDLHVERSKVVRASPDAVLPELTDMKLWVTWSPWADRDPDVKWTFSEPTSGVGAWYEWKGNDDVGQGKMEVTAVEAGEVRYALTFIEPFPSEAVVTFKVEPTDEGTKVSWIMDSENAFASKMFMVFADFDALLGADFELGLDRLAAKVEA